MRYRYTMSRLILEFVNLFFAGILAGLEVAAHYGFHGPTAALGETPQLVLRQGVIRRLRWLVPAFFGPTLLSGVALTVRDGAAPGAVFRLAALLALALWIGVRIVGTVPVNAATLDWDPSSPPPGWREKIAKTEQFHIIGAWAALLAFACFLLASALRLAH